MGLFDQSYIKASAQSKAVRAYLEMYEGVENSWNNEFKQYSPVNIAEWHNGRERGYVVMFNNNNGLQLNIAFFEHRNSDEICAIKWVQNTINPPTIDNAKFGDVYTNKYDVRHSVSVGHAMDMAAWIYEQLQSHWGDK